MRHQSSVIMLALRRVDGGGKDEVDRVKFDDVKMQKELKSYESC